MPRPSTYIETDTGPYLGFVYTGGTYVLFRPPVNARAMSVQAINKHGRVVGTYKAAGKLQHAFIYYGGAVTTFGDYPAEDAVSVAINGHGLILLSDRITQGSSASYRIDCAGPGC